MKEVIKERHMNEKENECKRQGWPKKKMKESWMKQEMNEWDQKKHRNERNKNECNERMIEAIIIVELMKEAKNDRNERERNARRIEWKKLEWKLKGIKEEIREMKEQPKEKNK